MIRFTQEQLLEKARLRKSGYVDAMLKNSYRIDENTYAINPEKNRQIIEEYRITKIFFTKEELEQKAKSKGQGYKKEIEEIAKIDSNGNYEVDIFLFDEIEKKYRNPGLFEMIKNAGEAALEAVNSGLDVRNKEDTEKALFVCSECPRLIVDQFRCGECGCFLNYKIKLKAWHCPLNKW